MRALPTPRRCHSGRTPTGPITNTSTKREVESKNAWVKRTWPTGFPSENATNDSSTSHAHDPRRASSNRPMDSSPPNASTWSARADSNSDGCRVRTSMPSASVGCIDRKLPADDGCPKRLPSTGHIRLANDVGRTRENAVDGGSWSTRRQGSAGQIPSARPFISLAVGLGTGRHAGRCNGHALREVADSE